MESCLYLLQAVVRRHHRHQTVAVRTVGETFGVSTPAARPSRALCRVFGAARTVRCAKRSSPRRAKPLLPSRLTLDYCYYHSRGGDYAHPAASEARRSPTPHCACPYPPRTVRLGRLARDVARGLVGNVRAVEVCLLSEYRPLSRSSPDITT
jgi:hypothetical protein